MNNKKQIESNSYWNYSNDKGWWHFKWNDMESKAFLLKNLKMFIDNYIELVSKYKILTPLDEWLINDTSNVVNINQLYYSSELDKFFYSCVLYIYEDKKILSKNISDISFNNSNEKPIYIWNKMFHDEDKMPYIYMYTQSDLFFLNLKNDKTWVSENLKIKNNGIDNSELAYLNTPRFNSFLRDLKKLCFKYKAQFSFESHGYDSDVNENGIFFNEEIIYYEDIVEMLDKRFQIVDLTIDTDW